MSSIAYALLDCIVAIALIAVFGRVNLSRREKVCGLISLSIEVESNSVKFYALIHQFNQIILEIKRSPVKVKS